MADRYVGNLVRLAAAAHGSTGGQKLVKVGNGLNQALLQLHLGLPVVQVRARTADVGLALQGVVRWQGHEDHFGTGACQGNDQFGQLANGELYRVTQVDRARETGCAVGATGQIHEADEAFDQVVYIAKAAGLLAAAVQGYVLALQRLHDEVADHATVVGVHARAIGVEDAGHADVKLVLAVIVKKKGFGAALTFVVAASDTDGVNVAPVGLSLRVDGGVTIDFAGAGLKDLGAQALGQPQHVDGTVHAGLGGLHWVVLVVDGAGRASQVVDLVHLKVQRKSDIVPDELKARMAKQVLHVALGAGEEVVGTDNVITTGEQPVDQV